MVMTMRKRRMTPGGHKDICRVDNCGRARHYSDGLCTMHKKRLERHGSLAKPVRRKPKKPCLIEGCGAPKAGHGLCSRHLTRLREGQPLVDRDIVVLPGEEWRPVVGFEGFYSVSSYGRLRRDAPGIHTYAGKILQPRLDGRGYLATYLSAAGKRSYLRVHRLVARAFLGPANGLEVNHIDLDKQNNRLINLEYVTQAENKRHAHAAYRERRLQAQAAAAKHLQAVDDTTQDALFKAQRALDTRPWS